jgi:hypothetical protein
MAPGTPDYPRFQAGPRLLAAMQDARTRYLCLFRTGRARLPCRSMMMYLSRDPVDEPT